jgi:hypothetical protein
VRQYKKSDYSYAGHGPDPKRGVRRSKASHPPTTEPTHRMGLWQAVGGMLILNFFWSFLSPLKLFAPHPVNAVLDGRVKGKRASPKETIQPLLTATYAHRPLKTVRRLRQIPLSATPSAPMHTTHHAHGATTLARLRQAGSPRRQSICAFTFFPTPLSSEIINISLEKLGTCR